MSARARWHTAELPAVMDDDPFEAPIEEVGQPINLADVEGRLQARLSDLLHREASLFNREITCEIKEADDTCCLGCPVSEAGDQGSKLGMLCRIGREQEVVTTKIAARRVRGRPGGTHHRSDALAR